MSGEILFSIPDQFLSGIADGSLIRIGALIKNTSTGQVLGHLQETGLAQQLLSGLSFAPFAPMSPAALSISVANGVVNTASSVYGNIQLHQIQSMLGTMQTLQFANLAVSIAGIGVSVAGFTVIYKKIKGIETSLSELALQMDKGFQELYDRELRGHYSQVSALFEKAELAHSLSDPKGEWLNIASQLTDQGSYFQGEIKNLLEKNIFDEELFISLFETMTLCDTGRIECLLLADEMYSAYKSAELIGSKYRKSFDSLSPNWLVNKKAPNKNKSNSRRDDQLKMTSLVSGLREITDMYLTKPMLIEHLIERNISGRNYLNTVRNDKNNFMLLLK